MAAGCVFLIGGERCICGDQLQCMEIDTKLFCRHLKKRGLNALPKFNLSRKDRYAVPGFNPDPGIKKGALLQASRQLRSDWCRCTAFLRNGAPKRTITNDQSAASG